MLTGSSAADEVDLPGVAHVLDGLQDRHQQQRDRDIDELAIVPGDGARGFAGDGEGGRASGGRAREQK